ncbi:hypothetical protein CHO01_36860 [Cellulomonas hominis]|uniref:Uncharacterized protein n=1 Tax=Cellulomonas hominis TaxID=156981 RepID=A0A511FH65_9CELL|nr:hypothetical protein [Cellulomonas hominis]MBB5474730.1 hypothetical protein [Cellulomonas hominis]NKY05992.1 hypothetical protein [Cellulomonas hominis]GEL48570.1 hypothetical protein CHO01_36860 [Cellulomonas hominis]
MSADLRSELAAARARLAAIDALCREWEGHFDTEAPEVARLRGLLTGPAPARTDEQVVADTALGMARASALYPGANLRPLRHVFLEGWCAHAEAVGQPASPEDLAAQPAGAVRLDAYGIERIKGPDELWHRPGPTGTPDPPLSDEQMLRPPVAITCTPKEHP